MYQNSLSEPRVRLRVTRFYGMGLSQGKPLGGAQSNVCGVGTSIGISTLYSRRANDSRRCHAHTHKLQGRVRNRGGAEMILSYFTQWAYKVDIPMEVPTPHALLCTALSILPCDNTMP